MNDPKSHAKDLKGWFLRRGYSQRIVKEQMGRVFSLPLKHDAQQNKTESGVPLVVTYNPTFRNLSRTLWKNFNEKLLKTSKCDSKRFQVCFNVSETYIFESFQTKKQYKINHHLDCSDKCLIY